LTKPVDILHRFFYVLTRNAYETCKEHNNHNEHNEYNEYKKIEEGRQK
jgi:hypothetical protein